MLALAGDITHVLYLKDLDGTANIEGPGRFDGVTDSHIPNRHSGNALCLLHQRNQAGKVEPTVDGSF